MDKLLRIAILFVLVFVNQGLTPNYRISQYAIKDNTPFYYDTDTLHLASIINAECGICDDSEQRKTGSVVLNRVTSNIFPNTIDSVISQQSQFSGYCSEHFYPKEECFKIAKELMSGFGRVEEILYFWNPKIAKDTQFINKMQKRVLYLEKYHHYAK